MNGKKLYDDRVVQEINKFITLNDEDTKRNNIILKEVLDDVIDTMKENDEFFRDNFQNIIFVGSYYKGTKVGKPEEFDLDLIIKLPIIYDSVKCESDLPGWTKLKVNTDSFTPKWHKHSKLLSKWVTGDGYLKQNEFRQWMEGLFSNMTPSLSGKNYELSVKKSGPAFTLMVDSGNGEMSVDLVPVLEFKIPPPVPGEFKDATWFAVPKPLKTSQNNPNLYWRMSFYNYEKSILKKNGYIKPIIRQVKKLRDRYDWKLIASYHIETLFMHELSIIEKLTATQKLNSTELFIHMLKRLKEACEKNEIINYWDKSDNLISNIDPSKLTNIIGCLKKIIKSIENDPLTIANFVLTKDELDDIVHIIDEIRQSNPIAKKKLLITIPTEIVGEQNKTPSSASSKSESLKTSRSSSNDGVEGNENLMDMLKSIRSDIADTSSVVNLLVRRVLELEGKVDTLLARSKDKTEDELIFGTQSISLTPMDGFMLTNKTKSGKSLPN